jgi:4-amino-4-deoxy-L-arabinose transferase-like glycosyltransferase
MLHLIIMKRRNPLKDNFLLAATAAALILYAGFFLQSTLSPDETVNLLLGKKILTLQYPDNFLHRMPLIPLLISPFFLLSLPAAAALFVLPLIFIALSVPVTYYFARDLCGEKTARISVIALLLFFVFWRWGIYVLTDVPLMVFMTLSLLYFFRGLKDARNFYPSGIFLGLSSVTKLSFLILPLSLLFYIAVTKKTHLLRKKEFLGGALLALLIFSAFFIAFGMMGQTASEGQLDAIEARLSDSGNIVIVQVLTGAEYTSASNFLQLALFPLLIFAPFGLLRKVKMKKLLILYSAIFLVLFVTVWVVRLRYFSPVFPIAMIFIAEGYLFLRGRFRQRKMLVDMAFIAVSALSLAATFYMMSLDANSLWGADELTAYTENLDGLIASDYLPQYLNLTGDVLMNTTATDQIFYGSASDSVIRENGVKYVVLSVYGEWNRMPDNDAYFYPTIGPLKISFIRRPYSNGRVPPDYTFGSGVYKALESDPGYRKITQIKRDSQVIFNVYEVVY